MSVPLLSDIVEIAHRLFPFDWAESWDNCGIQIGDPARPVESVAFSLDADRSTVEFAAKHDCRLLITHHPVLLEPLRNIIPDNPAGKTLLYAAATGVDILSLHTNLDACHGGLNDELATILGLADVTTPLPARCARLGNLSPSMGVRSLAAKVAGDLNLNFVRVIIAGDMEVRRVFCAAGSGMGYLKEAALHQADVIITGDVRYHAGREAEEKGMAVIDAGHYGLERIAVPLLLRKFKAEFEKAGMNVSCIPCDTENDPFICILNPQGGF